MVNFIIINYVYTKTEKMNGGSCPTFGERWYAGSRYYNTHNALPPTTTIFPDKGQIMPDPAPYPSVLKSMLDEANAAEKHLNDVNRRHRECQGKK